MADTSMQDAAEKQRKNKKVDSSMEDSIVNMNPEELVDYFKELKAGGATDDEIAALRTKAAESLASKGEGKASEFLQKINEKKEAAEAEAAAAPPEPPAEEEKKEEPKAEEKKEEEKPKRKRRTKAQMEAAREKAHGGKDADPNLTPVAADPAPETTPEPDPVEPSETHPQSAPMYSDEPSTDVVTETPSATEEQSLAEAVDAANVDADDDAEGPTLLIPDHGDLFLCEAVTDGYEEVGNMVSGPCKDMDEVKSATERYILDNEDGDVTDLYVVQVVKKVEFKKVISLVFS